MKHQRLKTPGEVAELLEIHLTKVYDLIRSGALQAEDHSLPGARRKTWRIDVSEVAAFRQRARRLTVSQIEHERRVSSPPSDDVIPFRARRRALTGCGR